MAKKESIVGIDEAGRGPVLGPLVMAALAVDKEGQKKLEWLGVKDSKLLSPTTREEMFDRIREIVTDFRVEVVEPDAIDLTLTEDRMPKIIVIRSMSTKNSFNTPLLIKNTFSAFSI